MFKYLSIVHHRHFMNTFYYVMILILNSFFNNTTTTNDFFVIAGGSKAPVPLWAKLFFGSLIMLYVLMVNKWNFKMYKKARAIKDIPTSKIRSIAMGQVEVKGNVKAIGEPMIDPIDNKKCVYFSLSVEEKVLGRGSVNGSMRKWKTIHAENKSKPFFLNDGTGSVLIPDSLIQTVKDLPMSEERGLTKIALDNTYNTYRWRPGEFPDSIKKYLEDKKILSEGMLLKKRMRIKITYIEPDDRLYILGNARPLNDSEKEFRENASVALDNKNVEYFAITDQGEKYMINVFKGIWWKLPASLILPFYYFYAFFVK